MDVRKRLLAITLPVLLLTLAGATLLTSGVLQQQALRQTQADDQHRLDGAATLAFTELQNELAHEQVAAKYLSVNPAVVDALVRQGPGSVQDDILEPNRRAFGLSFVSLVTPQRRQIAQVRAPSPNQVAGLDVVRISLQKQYDASQFWDGPDRPPGNPLPPVPYAVASSPVLKDNTLVGAVVVGLILDNTYMNRVSANLGDSPAALIKDGTLLALPNAIERQFAVAHQGPPFQPHQLGDQPPITPNNGGWHAADWQIGAARYTVVTRPLFAGLSTRTLLAVALPAAGPAETPPLPLTPIAARLAQAFGLPAAAVFGIALHLLWWLGLLLLLLLAAAAVTGGVQLAVQPVGQLAQRVEEFRRTLAWPGGAKAADGQVGRLSAAVTSLAHDAGDWRRELERYRDRLQSVLESMGAGVVVSDPAGRVELMNPVARELLGLGTGTPALPVQVTGGDSDGRRIQASNGRVINAVSTPIRAADGTTTGLVTVLEDMTQERELERVRTEFLTVVSHELRTPLTAVKGSLDLLLDGEAGDVDALQQRFLQTARRNTERLIALVNDLLDLSRLEAGQVRISVLPADLRRIVDDVVVNLGTLFERKHQQLHLELPERPLLVQADRRRFEQVVTNLLGNAATYTPEEGEIRIAARPDPATRQAVLTVWNSGPGIAPEDREHLFEKFYRGGNALTRPESGTGLGLAIVKSLVELHHGSIVVESEPGQGAAFVIRLPTIVGESRESAGRG